MSGPLSQRRVRCGCRAGVALAAEGFGTVEQLRALSLADADYKELGITMKSRRRLAKELAVFGGDGTPSSISRHGSPLVRLSANF